MIAVIDTDVMIDFQRGIPAALAWFESLDTLPLLPGLVAMELLQGAQNSAHLQIAEKLIEPITIVWPTAHDCHTALAHFRAFHLSHRLEQTSETWVEAKRPAILKAIASQI